MAQRPAPRVFAPGEGPGRIQTRNSCSWKRKRVLVAAEGTIRTQPEWGTAFKDEASLIHKVYLDCALRQVIHGAKCLPQGLAPTRNWMGQSGPSWVECQGLVPKSWSTLSPWSHSSVSYCSTAPKPDSAVSCLGNYPPPQPRAALNRAQGLAVPTSLSTTN